MFISFNDAARLVLRLADVEARRCRHDAVGTEHLLLALVQLHHCLGARVLARAGIRLDSVRQEVEKIVPAAFEKRNEDRLRLSPGARKAVEFALAAADRLGHIRVGTGHLLLGMLEEAEGVAFRVLCKLGIGRLGGNLSRVAEYVVAEEKGVRFNGARCRDQCVVVEAKEGRFNSGRFRDQSMIAKDIAEISWAFRW